MIRIAKLSDRPHFLRLWSRQLEEQEKEGSHLRSDMQNLYRCLDLFEAYTLGNDLGFCLLAQPDDAKEPIGAVMAGELLVPYPFKTDLGKLATLWGVYVDPPFRGRGLGVKLFQEALEVGLKLGFDSVETYVRTDNPHGQQVAESFGTKPYMVQSIASLHDPDLLSNEGAKRALARGVSDD